MTRAFIWRRKSTERRYCSGSYESNKFVCPARRTDRSLGVIRSPIAPTTRDLITQRGGNGSAAHHVGPRPESRKTLRRPYGCIRDTLGVYARRGIEGAEQGEAVVRIVEALMQAELDRRLWEDRDAVRGR